MCLDPEDLNTAIRRTYHKTPTFKEITHKLQGSTTFSKLDAKSGYWCVQLDQDSSALTSFNSPAGLYHFKGLPFGLRVSQDVKRERKWI